MESSFPSARFERRRQIAWGRILLACLALPMAFLGVIFWAYRHDFQQLNEFSESRRAVAIRLRGYQVCLDMQENPENWKNKALQPPCEYGPEVLHDLIPQYEAALADWNRAISDRRKLILARRNGRFGFIEKLVERETQP